MKLLMNYSVYATLLQPKRHERAYPPTGQLAQIQSREFTNRLVGIISNSLARR